MPYKVVEKQTRHCSNWAIYKTHFQETKVLKYRRDHPEWFPRYFKGRVIEKAPGSIGILCFERKIDAIAFSHSYKDINWITISVEGTDEQQGSSFLISGCGCYPERLGRKTSLIDRISFPIGTILYRNVLVLE